ncbi:uncharacterized protein B0I36DRAFT_387602 [Microdochium trichocladiopsis]|uniref:Rhodopsin domain-containing protein n=1 Tax=Microdochium trichocladiopsis TaxID=1682393 RepID=A0A9P8XUM3_9PEZI|nr:uncharacterized protein B0I36DRAFT_387602 [Microdochium trichocladiopsis]KAH7020746.1 hypothetical protein B0I36DRAFT_387602 [Microdochium trichocladiopsis]
MAELESRSLEIRSVALAAWALALVAVVLRVCARAFIMKAFAADDWLMVAAMIAFTASTVTCVLATIEGSGMHTAEVPPERIENALMWLYACYPSIAVTLATSKLSVGCYLLRITNKRVHRWIIFLALGATIVASSIFFFVTVLQCRPISFAWEKISETGTCIDIDTIINIMYAYSALTLFTDIAFTLLPAWLVFHLQMSLKTKLALTLVLGMACLASTAVIIRFPHLRDFKDPDPLCRLANFFFVGASSTISIWTQIEASLAITGGSFATLRPLYRILLVKLGLTTKSTPTYGRSGAIEHNCPGGGGNSSNFNKSRQTARNMFGMTTFNRMEDDGTDDEESSGRGEAIASTTDLHSKTPAEIIVAPRV